MRFRYPLALSSTFLLALSLLSPVYPTTSNDEGAENTQIIRVGIISYDNYRDTFDRYANILHGIAQRSKTKAVSKKRVVFRLALGSYSDVLDWYNKDQVDLAFFTPEPLAELKMSMDKEGPDVFDNLYIASHASDYTTATPNFEYHSMCAVKGDSNVNSIEQLKSLAQKGRVNFLFVDPLSTSGRVLPQYSLHANQIDNIKLDHTEAGGPGVSQNVVTWTYSPHASIKELEKSRPPQNNGRVEVAFFSARELPETLKQLPFRGLDEITIPEEAVLINRAFITHKSEVEDLFEVRNNPHSHFQKVQGVGQEINKVAGWIRNLHISSRDPESQMVTLEQIGKTIRSYEIRYNKHPRVALVLSGGGAKCAYELGAIQAIESEIDKTDNLACDEKEVDIDLVVGTSGGAINALCVALGLTRDKKTPQSRFNNQNLVDTWMNFKQRDFFYPWPTVRYMLGLCIGILEALLIIAIINLIVWLGNKSNFNIQWLRKSMGVILVALGLLDFYILWSNWTPSLGVSHWWYHVWLLLTLNVDVSAVCLTLIGCYILVRSYRQSDNPDWMRRFSARLSSVLTAGLIAVVLLSLFWEKTLSRSQGVELTLANKISSFVKQSDPQDQQAFPKGTSLVDLSRYIEPRLQRDLIITGSRLENQDENSGVDSDPLPDDLYFYYDYVKDSCRGVTTQEFNEKCNPKAPNDNRFYPFGDNLMDVVIGSSSIYPIFPARPIKDFYNHPQIDVIDGGFAHNSPIEAAVLWRATHIILIEASPIVPMREASLYNNAKNALNHLYYQAQLLDARARGKVEIYTLRPSAPKSPNDLDMCTFDFHEKLIFRAIRQGKEDAKSVLSPHFLRAPGEPEFTEIGLEWTQPKSPKEECE